MQRNVDPSGGRVHTARRDGPSSALGASVARVARRRSVRSACTSGDSETSTKVPPRQFEFLQPRARIHLRVRTSTSGPSMSPSPFRVLPSTPNKAAGCRPSYSVLAMRSVRRHSGCLEPSAAARPGLLSSTARCDAALGGTTCAAGGTPTKWGSRMWVIRSAGGYGEKVFEERVGARSTSVVTSAARCGAPASRSDACVGIVGGELERTVERELHGGAEALRDAGKLV
ncbi:hypothetical protein EDB83DRAFT_2450052 [Lactarius deliciosus]|nr:hypothetical protein EDB83DRAFT_2450052 [Lactarius deliciosus]